MDFIELLEEFIDAKIDLAIENHKEYYHNGTDSFLSYERERVSKARDALADALDKHIREEH